MIKFSCKIILTLIPVFILLACDYLFGFFYEWLAPDYGKRHLDFILNPIDNNITKTSINPYLAYFNTPNFSEGGVKQHNSDGYRNSYETPKFKEKDTFRILCIGGSTTYGSGVSDPKLAWPEVLQNFLNTNPPSQLNKKKFEVLNGGLGWGSSAELLTHYSFKHINYHPDIVIIHTGGNDVGALALNNFQMDYSHWRNFYVSGSSFFRPMEKSLIESSNFAKYFYSLWFNKIPYQQSNLVISTKMFKHLPPRQTKFNLTNNSTDAYRNNLTNLLAIIKNTGSTPIFFQFYMPTYRDLKEKNPSAFLNASRLIGDQLLELDEALFAGRMRLKSEAQNVCETEDVIFWEIDRDNLPEKYFVDQCHLNMDGQVEKARFIYNNILNFLNE